MATNSKFIADIGIKTDSDLQIGGNATIDGNATVSGNLTVNGTSLTVNATTTSVEDNMLELANANTSSDTLDIGIYGNYDDGLSDGGATEYTGLFRDASDSTWKLFDGLEVAPTTTVNTSGTGYTLADLTVGDLTATTLTATNGLTGSSITYPTSDGTNGQVITTNGSGTLSFGDIPAGYTDSDARSAISVSGNLAYNSSTGVISYSEPTMYADSDARSAISAGTGISYNSSTGVITNTVSNTDTTYSAGTGLTLTGTTFSNNITQYTDSDVGTYLSSNGYATQSTIVAAITDSAPATLDTLNELAAALGDDANFSTTVTNSIALKAPLASPVFSGTVDMGTFGNRTRAFEAYGSNVLFDGGSDKIDLIIGDGSSAYMSIQTTDTASAMNIRDYSGNADLVTIERGTGNVGIGLTGPQNSLHIHATGDSRMQFTNATSGTGYSDGTWMGIDATQAYFLNRENTPITFWTNATERMRISSDGQVQVVNTGNVKLDALKGSRFGYSSAYPCAVIGGTGTTTSDNIAIGYDPSTNASGSFTGYGEAIYFRNNVTLRTPNTANNGFHSVQQFVDGTVLAPNQPSFFCYPSSSFTASGGSLKYTFAGEAHDSNNEYNHTTGKFTAPVAGRYMFLCNLAIESSTSELTYMGIGVRKNNTGSVYFGGWGDKQSTSNAHYAQASSSIIMSLAQGDYIELYIELSGSHTVLGGNDGAYTRFCGQLLS